MNCSEKKEEGQWNGHAFVVADDTKVSDKAPAPLSNEILISLKTEK